MNVIAPGAHAGAPNGSSTPDRDRGTLRERTGGPATGRSSPRYRTAGQRARHVATRTPAVGNDGTVPSRE